ncbi:MAG: hypothetical protein QOD96_7623, partial [Pseudonocardiales bacterium]|nr:hypothetical protein [Pseudonocardiales bacterium]
DARFTACLDGLPQRDATLVIV